MLNIKPGQNNKNILKSEGLADSDTPQQTIKQDIN